jgi:hypothetical protein
MIFLRMRDLARNHIMSNAEAAGTDRQADKIPLPLDEQSLQKEHLLPRPSDPHLDNNARPGLTGPIRSDPIRSVPIPSHLIPSIGARHAFHHRCAENSTFFAALLRVASWIEPENVEINLHEKLSMPSHSTLRCTR